MKKIKLLNNQAATLSATHIAGWIAFVGAMFLENAELRELIQKDPLPMICNILMLAVYFYLNMYLFVPRLLSKKRIVAYTGVTLLSFAVICFVLPWLIRYLHSFNTYDMFPHHRPEGFESFPQRHHSLELDTLPHRRHAEGFEPFSQGRFQQRLRPHEIAQRLSFYTRSVQFSVVFIVSTGLKVIAQWFREKQQLQDLEKSKIQAELSFLKSQIHPHFLFNCLNSIYFLVLSKDEKAPKTVLSLSNFLRFVIIESESDFIPLEKEIDMLEEYVNLQRLRATEKFELQFVKDGDFGAYSIMPLTFIPFVENAFKFGISAHINCFIHIHVAMRNGTLHFVCNNSVAAALTDRLRSSGIGLENIRKRLELAYPNRHTLETGETSEIFYVRLQICMK